MRTSRLAVVILALLCYWPTLASGQTVHAPTSVHVAAALTPSGGSTTIEVGDDWQTKINAGNPGQVFLIKTGTHRFQSVSPKAGQVFIGETGAIMSGARVLASGSFVTAGSFWKITGQTQAMATRAGTCQTLYPGCSYREELFVDNTRKVHVQTLAEMGAGEWFFNYDTDEIYVGDNPAGHVVETSITTTAFNPSANSVAIDNITVEKYASPAQYGAINAEDTMGWIVTDSTIRLNHGGGIRYGSSVRIQRNTITHNGQEGVVGIGNDALFEDNEIAYNNEAHFDPFWEAGGTKFVLSNNLTVRGNNVHHNEGPGLWTDSDNNHVLIEDNTCNDNDQAGIFHEVSFDAIIRNNTVRRNGSNGGNGPAQAGIMVAASSHVEVYGNTVEDNAWGIIAYQEARGSSGLYGLPYETHDLNVHGNTVKTAGYSGLIQTVSDTTYFSSRNNHFEANTYLLETNTNKFQWDDGIRSFATWQGYGNDSPSGSATTY